MTVKELRIKLEELEKTHADNKITIHTFGGLCGANTEVKSIGPGFDWTSGQVVIQTKQPITYYRPEKNKKDNEIKRPGGSFNFNGEECRM